MKLPAAPAVRTQSSDDAPTKCQPVYTSFENGLHACGSNSLPRGDNAGIGHRPQRNLHGLSKQRSGDANDKEQRKNPGFHGTFLYEVVGSQPKLDVELARSCFRFNLRQLLLRASVLPGRDTAFVTSKWTARFFTTRFQFETHALNFH